MTRCGKDTFRPCWLKQKKKQQKLQVQHVPGHINKTPSRRRVKMRPTLQLRFTWSTRAPSKPRKPTCTSRCATAALVWMSTRRKTVNIVTLRVVVRLYVYPWLGVGYTLWLVKTILMTTFCTFVYRPRCEIALRLLPEREALEARMHSPRVVPQQQRHGTLFSNRKTASCIQTNKQKGMWLRRASNTWKIKYRKTTSSCGFFSSFFFFRDFEIKHFFGILRFHSFRQAMYHVLNSK